MDRVELKLAQIARRRSNLAAVVDRKRRRGGHRPGGGDQEHVAVEDVTLKRMVTPPRTAAEGRDLLTPAFSPQSYKTQNLPLRFTPPSLALDSKMSRKVYVLRPLTRLLRAILTKNVFIFVLLLAILLIALSRYEWAWKGRIAGKSASNATQS